MDLDELRVGIDRQQRGRGKHVGGRFENPSLTRFPELQVLQKAPMRFVGRPQVLTEKPCAISRNIIHGVELIAHESRAH